MSDKEILEYAIVFGILGGVVCTWLIFDTRDFLWRVLFLFLASIFGIMACGGIFFLNSDKPEGPKPRSQFEGRKSAGPPVRLTPDGKPYVITIKPDLPPGSPIPARPVKPLPPVVDDEGNVLPEYLDENGEILPMIIRNGKIQPPHPWAETDDETQEDPDVVITPEPDPSEYGRMDGWEE